MEIIEKGQIPKDLFYEAKKFSVFRNDVKNFLRNNNKEFDKFTITDHDSYLGYFTEHVVKDYICSNIELNDYRVVMWEYQFDLDKIKEIVQDPNPTNDDIKYVQTYFYDSYDLKLTDGKNEIRLDVKTAETMKTPSLNWNFLYPVVQAQKSGKDFTILCYYVKETKNLEDLKDITIVGYITQKDICSSDVIHANEYTKQHTKSQIDNYNTSLKNYKDIKNIETFL